MNYVILNGEVLDETKANIHISNRAFRYGDALFETIAFNKGEIKFFQYHWDRLTKGMDKLYSKYKQIIDYETIKLEIFQLLELNNKKSDAKVRLQVFRNQGGLYTPNDNSVSYLLESKFVIDSFDVHLNIDTPSNVGFCESICLNHSTISDLKTCNSMPYILASIERERKKLHDLILTDSYNNVAECCSSNIFWWDGNKIFTPDLQSGCIAGVMRRVLLENFYKDNIDVEVGLFPKALLKSAQAIFTSNCMGVKFVNTIFDKEKVWHSTDTEQFTKSQAFASIQSLF